MSPDLIAIFSLGISAYAVYRASHAKEVIDECKLELDKCVVILKESVKSIKEQND